MSKSNKIYLVHCIDTEGPLYESLSATFERLNHIFHLQLEPSKNTLLQLQRGEIDLGGIEKSVQKVVDSKILTYNDTWDKIDLMLDKVLSGQFRNRVLDVNGNGWIYNWFCVDHVNYEVNARRRDIGYHNIFDHYNQILQEKKCYSDGLHFHYHPQPFIKHAHLCATRWLSSSDTLDQVLSRRIIDKNWFPAVNRPGFQVNRPDSHWFLEQYIPFDMASLAKDSNSEDEQQFDFSDGRSGDWRRAPRSWEPYHPSHDDYQLKGNCRRWIARCLNVGTRSYLLGEKEVEQAFLEAREDKPVVLAFANHDFRDISHDVDYVRNMIQKVKRNFPEIEFEYCEAMTAMRKSLNLKKEKRCNLTLSLKAINDSTHILKIKSDTPIFGPQPYLAIKTVTEKYYHDNFDFQVPKHEWTYIFDKETFPIKAVESIGVGVNNSYGTTSVSVLDIATETVKQTWYNE